MVPVVKDGLGSGGVSSLSIDRCSRDVGNPVDEERVSRVRDQDGRILALTFRFLLLRESSWSSSSGLLVRAVGSKHLLRSGKYRAMSIMLKVQLRRRQLTSVSSDVSRLECGGDIFSNAKSSSGLDL